MARDQRTGRQLRRESHGGISQKLYTRGKITWAGRRGMAIGFVLISTAPAKEHEVFNALSDMEAIKELHPLFGEYDLIAKIEADDFNVLGQIVVDKIRTIQGVIDTKTLTGIQF